MTDTNTDMKDRVDAHTKDNESIVNAAMRRMSALQQLHAIQDELGRTTPQMNEWLNELKRIGETDANAGKVITATEALTRLMTLTLVAVRAVIDLRT